MKLVSESLYALHVPLRDTFKFLLEIPGLFKQILQHVEKLSNGKTNTQTFFKENCG